MDYDVSSNTLDTLDEVEEDEHDRWVVYPSLGGLSESLVIHSRTTTGKKSSRVTARTFMLFSCAVIISTSESPCSCMTSVGRLDRFPLPSWGRHRCWHITSVFTDASHWGGEVIFAPFNKMHLLLKDFMWDPLKTLRITWTRRWRTKSWKRHLASQISSLRYIRFYSILYTHIHNTESSWSAGGTCGHTTLSMALLLL